MGLGGLVGEDGEGGGEEGADRARHRHPEGTAQLGICFTRGFGFVLIEQEVFVTLQWPRTKESEGPQIWRTWGSRRRRRGRDEEERSRMRRG